MERKEYMKSYHRQYWKDNHETLKKKSNDYWKTYTKKQKVMSDGIFSIRHGEFYPFK